MIPNRISTKNRLATASNKFIPFADVEVLKILKSDFRKVLSAFGYEHHANYADDLKCKELFIFTLQNCKNNEYQEGFVFGYAIADKGVFHNAQVIEPWDSAMCEFFQTMHDCKRDIYSAVSYVEKYIEEAY